MFEIDKVLTDTCHVCGKRKTVGLFNISSAIQIRHVPICPACLDNFSRLICKQTDKIKWNRATMKFENIFQEDIKAWEALYPGLDVMEIIEKKAPEWIIRKCMSGEAVKSDYRRFIMNWLKRDAARAVGL